jgi:hypothetical protein
MNTPPTQPGTTSIQPPYGIILKELRHGSAIPFLGAAASRVGYKDGDPTYLPSGADLAEALAKEAEFPSLDQKDRTDLVKVSSYYVDASSRGALRRELRSVFADGRYRCNDLHRLLARIADKMMIVTTNYDTLLEQAFLDAKKPYDLVVYPADNDQYKNAMLWWPHGAVEPDKLRPNDIDPANLGKTNVIYKMHGSVRQDKEDWDSFVITEEDYVDFLSRFENAVPSAFHTYFSARSFLFLGYGLKDWNLRVLLKKVNVSEITSWAILHAPSAFERKLWERRGVDIFDLKLEEFVAAMQARM